MKTDIIIQHGLRIDPKVVKKYTNAGRKREPRTDSCLDEGTGELWEEWKPRPKPQWLGCTAVLPGGKKCYGRPIFGDKCFLHGLKF